MQATENMNKAQRIAFRNVLDYVLMHGHYEVKELEVKTFDFSEDVYISLETGIPNDEGTMAEVFCRDMLMFFIGKRGGLYHYGKGCKREYLKPWDLTVKANTRF